MLCRLSTIKIYTTLKHASLIVVALDGLSTIKIYTTLKLSEMIFDRALMFKYH